LHDISLHILDLIENSLNARATVVAIRVAIDQKADLLKICVQDNGSGLKAPPEQVLNPFYTTHKTKKVGLGLSLFKAAAEMAAGQLVLSHSEALGGVAAKANMRLSHIDRPPLGDLAATISTMVLINPEVDFRFTIQSEDRNYSFQLSEFAARHGLNAGANVELANAANVELQEELKAWKRYDLPSSSPERRGARRPYLWTGPNSMEQGADA
jgi:hypothetical protein